MFRKLLTTTALAALFATGAVAQDAATTAAGSRMPFELTAGFNAADTDNLATRIIGQPVYTSAALDAENIGDVNDLVLDDMGGLQAVIIGVGGFLGIGEKNVAVAYSDLQFVRADDDTERWVLETTKEALAAAPDFQFIEDDVTPTDSAAVTTLPAEEPNAMTADPAAETAALPDKDPLPAAEATDPAADTAAVAPTDNAVSPADDVTDESTEVAATPDPDMTTEVEPEEGAAVAVARPAEVTTFDPATLTEFDEATLSADQLIGTGVIGADNTQIAEVGDLILTEGGQIDAILVDFGGFLGIGEKRVAVGFEDLDFRTDANGNRYVFMTFTREQLDAATAYDEATYATDRDSQRLVVAM